METDTLDHRVNSRIMLSLYIFCINLYINVEFYVFLRLFFLLFCGQATVPLKNVQFSAIFFKLSGRRSPSLISCCKSQPRDSQWTQAPSKLMMYVISTDGEWQLRISFQTDPINSELVPTNLLFYESCWRWIKSVQWNRQQWNAAKANSTRCLNSREEIFLKCLMHYYIYVLPISQPILTFDALYFERREDYKDIFSSRFPLDFPNLV